MIRKAALAIALGASFLSIATATTLAEVRGNWALHVDGKPIIVLRLGGDGASPTGQMIQPKGRNVTNALFTVSNPTQYVHPLSRFEDRGDYALATFRDAAGKTTEFRLRAKSEGLEVAVAGVPPGVGLGPWTFDRASAKESVATDWQPGRAYLVGDSDTSNQELGRLFREDQEARLKTPIDWTALARDDESRRKRTLELITSDSLHTGADFKEAAFIMQHGKTPDDYLLAHSLALAAMAKGAASAAWFAAATLDRFLWSRNLPQIYGTQTKDDGKGGHKTSQPCNDSLIDASLRKQLGVLNERSP
jgi:hypothetical protein